MGFTKDQKAILKTDDVNTLKRELEVQQKATGSKKKKVAGTLPFVYSACTHVKHNLLGYVKALIRKITELEDGSEDGSLIPPTKRRRGESLNFPLLAFM